MAEVNAVFVSLLASCSLHKIEPFAYMRDLLCLVPRWPSHRVLACRKLAFVPFALVDVRSHCGRDAAAEIKPFRRLTSRIDPCRVRCPVS